MNRFTFLFLRVTVFLALATSMSCVHELPRTCVGVKLELNVTKTDATVGQTNGAILAISSGESNYFTYSLNKLPFQATNEFTGLDSGTYTVSVRNSWGCTNSTQVRINKVDPCAGVVLSAVTTNTAPGKSTGSIAAVLSTGTGYQFSLNNGAAQTSNLFNGLAAGQYTLKATNTSGCSFTAPATVGTNNPCAGIVVVVTAQSTNPTAGLNDGSITVTATGATGFTYSLNNGAFQASNVFNGLGSATYVVTAKSADGCLGVTQVVLGTTNPCAGVTVTVTLTSVNASVGQNNGSITASASGGSGFTYSLNNGAYQSGATFSGLAAGTYSVIAKNSSGCLGSSSTTVGSNDPCANTTITLTTATTTSDNCVTPGTGSITVTATGSTGFTYNVNGGTYQAGNIFSALAPGTYTIGVKDVNQCTKTATATVSTVAPGVTFAPLKVLIQTRCSGGGCHMNGQSQKGYNFDTDCKIVSQWSGIYNATISGKLTKMPISPQANLTTAEKQIIIDWYNAGHTYGN